MRGRRLGFFLVGIVASSGLRAVNTGTTGTGDPVPTMQPSTTLQCLLADQGTYSSEGAGGAPAGGVPMLAEIRLFAGNIVPGGYHRPEGQLLPIASNIALFTIFGTTYGGNGVSTFAYPDLRGRAIAGKGSRPGLIPRALGEPFGSENVTVGLTELPPHTHGGPGGATSATGGGFPLPTWQPSLAVHPVICTVEAFESPGYLPEIRFFAGGFQPGPWLTCDGRLLSTDDYPELYAAIGAAFGGDGVSTFALPDLRDAVAVGAGTGPGLPPRVLNEYAGLELFYLTSNQMAGHAHTLATGVTGTAGSGQAFENHQPSVALRFAIAVEGVYPSSDGPNFSEIPTMGEVRLFASNGPLPARWVFAEGQILPIASNTVLYSILGNMFGGNGASTFALPDLRGRTPICMGEGPGLTFRPLGQMVGTPTASLTVGQLAAHAHVVDPLNTRRPGEPAQLRLGKEPGDPSQIYLLWGDGCSSGATGYAVYQGALGSFASHTLFNGACGVADTSLSLQTPCAGSCYYLVSSLDDQVGEEGSLGKTSAGAERPGGSVPCRAPVDTAVCN